MTNTEKLRELIKQSGYKKAAIAEYLGITTYSLQLKLENKREFKASEIRALCDMLKISNDMIPDIFLNVE